MAHSDSSDFDDRFLTTLPDENWAALEAIADRAFQRVFSRPPPNPEGVINFLAVVESVCHARGIDAGLAPFAAHPDPRSNFEQAVQRAQTLKDRAATIRAAREHETATARARLYFAQRLGNPFMYRFSDAELSRVQQLVNDLRHMISGCESFKVDHRRRLLRRLEQLQGEMHKEMSSLERGWGFVGQAGASIGQFGRDIKPAVDRLRELASIFRKAEAQAEGLPAPEKVELLLGDAPVA